MGVNKAMDGFVTGATIMIVGTLMSWIVGLFATSFLRNSTGDYESTITATIAPLLTPILISLSVLTGLLVMIYSAKHAAQG